MLKTLTIAAIAITAAFTVVPAHAALVDNGSSLNGGSENGGSLNGGGENAQGTQGIQFQGTSLKGNAETGAARQDQKRSGGLRVLAIELPAADR